MKPEQIHDIILAIGFFILFLIIGTLFRPTVLFAEGFSGKDKFVYENLELRDEESVFFLNLLKTNVEDKTISDLIILNENEDQDLKEKIEEILKFYGRDYYEYGLTIKYPDREPILFGCDYEVDKGIKQNLPSLNGGLIELKFKFQGGECFISPI